MEDTFLGLVLLRFALILKAHGTPVHFILVNPVLAAEAFGVVCKQGRGGSDTSKAASALRFSSLRARFQHSILFPYFVHLGPHPQHVELPRLGVHSELQLAADTHSPSNAGSEPGL